MTKRDINAVVHRRLAPFKLRIHPLKNIKNKNLLFFF